jgi:peptidoglycan/xylan/chitin deacetylase (PgdA/CDA1 family)
MARAAQRPRAGKPRKPRGFWPGGASLALSLVVNVEEGAEQNIQDGDPGPEAVDELGIALRKPVRNFGNESNYQYGINEAAPRVLRLLASRRVPATFTAAAQALERAPQVARGIVAGGHEACAHGWRWQATMGMDEATERAFIARARDSIAASCGVPPAGWLSRYMHTAATRRLLVEEGYSYHMDDFSRDEPFWDRSAELPRPMLVLPYALDSNDMKFWSHPGMTPAAWLEYARDTFDWLLAEARGSGAPRMMSLGIHLRIMGRPGRIGAYQGFLRHATRARGVWIATRRDIAAHFAARRPA